MIELVQLWRQAQALDPLPGLQVLSARYGPAERVLVAVIDLGPPHGRNGAIMQRLEALDGPPANRVVYFERPMQSDEPWIAYAPERVTGSLVMSAHRYWFGRWQVFDPDPPAPAPLPLF